jgi:hypothetical protein
MAHGLRSNADFADALQRRSLVETLTEPTQAAGLAVESLRWLNHLLGRFHAAADVCRRSSAREHKEVSHGGAR